MSFLLFGRFWSKVDKETSQHGCWLWTACTNSGGYGLFYYKGVLVVTHRLAYEQLVEPIEEGHHLDHYRMNLGPRHAPCSRSCCNPAHLDVVTPKENINRGRTGQLNAVKTHCPRGHIYNEKNTYTRIRHGNRMRECRVCKRDAERVRKQSLR